MVLNLKCERCEIESGSIFCLRCKRAICTSCYDRSLALCSDCTNYKNVIEWDRRQLVRTLAETITDSTKKIETSSCGACEILRYHLLYILKVLKNLEIELEKEDLSGLKKPVAHLREAVIPLIIEAVAQKNLIADPAAWSRI